MSRWAGKYVIGLTGNIAAGKSVVRQMLQHLGAYTIDADGLAHQAMQPGAPSYKPIVDTFGQLILNPDKSINRAMLGNIVFANPTALATLEKITHPVVGQAINALVTRAKQRVVVIEAIKLLEGDLANAVDVVWVVDAAPETRIKRLIEKRKMSEAEAKQRVAAQSPQAEKLKRATLVIRNDGNVEDTWKQVQAAWEGVKQAVIASMSGGAAPKPATATLPSAQPAQPSTPPAAPKPPAATPPAAPKPAAAAPAQPAPRPAAPSAPEEDTPGPTLTPPTDVTVKRGMPNNAAAIAEFMNKVAGKNVSRGDIMMAFGEKSYLLAQGEAGEIVAVLGWQVENLITRADEFYLAPNAPLHSTITALVIAVEEASKELQSEVGFIFLPTGVSQPTIDSFIKAGYELTTVPQIKIPAWREAVQEVVSEGVQILTKRLRKDRVLKPI